jgi:D-alanine-D-alanine ligase-like ATP-grasp enzyme
MKYGATFNDVSTEIHSSIIESCRKAMKLIGLRYAGFDYISGDISSPDGCFNEVNSMPSIKLSYSYASSDVVIKVIQEAIKIA